VSDQDEIIRASEIGQYAYCARAWWLGQVQGYRSSNLAAMQQGSAEHSTHGQAVAGYHRLRWLAAALLVVAVVVLIAGLLLAAGG
jgi:hypothetical protein